MIEKITIERKMKPDVNVGDLVTNKAFATNRGSQFLRVAWRCVSMAMKPYDHTIGQEETWVACFVKDA